VDHLERRLQVGVKLAVLDTPSPELIDDRRLLNPDWADLNARVALHARPDRVDAHAIDADDRLCEPVSVRSVTEQLADHATDTGRAHRRIRLLAQLEDHIAGRKRPAGCVRWARLMALAAFRARVELKQV
jgi:hypothetical protein